MNNILLIFQCLLKEFPKLFSEKKELFVLKCWCCIVPVLGEVNDILCMICRAQGCTTM